MKTLALIIIITSLPAISFAESTCTQTWPDVLTKVRDLRKLNDCSPEYTLKECQTNLGLVGGAAAGAAVKSKLPKNTAPTSCGLLGLRLPNGSPPNSFVSFLVQSQMPYSYAASSCFKNFDAEKKEAQDVIREHREALQKELEAAEKASGSSFSKVASKHPALKALQIQRSTAIHGYMDYVGGPLRPSDLKEAVAKLDQQIEDYIRNYPAASADAREELRAVSDAMERGYATGRPEDAVAEFAAARAGKGANAGRIQFIKDQLDKLSVAEAALNGSSSVLPANFAKSLEAAAQDLPDAELSRIAAIRMKFAEKFPSITMSRTSKLAINGFRTEFDKAKKKLIAKPKMLRRIPLVGKVAGGLVSAAVSGITLAAETTNEGRTDALSDMVMATNHGCDAKYSEWAPIDEECRVPKEWNSGTAAFVELDEASLKVELKNDSSGDLCKQILDMHKKYFPAGTKASCSGSSVIIKDDSARQNYVASWDATGALTTFKFNGEYKNNRGYTMNFKDGSISSIEHKGPIFSGSIVGEDLKNNQHAADFAEHFSRTSARVMELQACCMGKISDSRCSPIEGRQSAGGAGGSGTSTSLDGGAL